MALSQRVYGRAARGGVYGVYLLAEDPDFLYYYQYAAKGRGVYGLIGRKHITSVLPVREKAAEPPAQTVGRSFFCGRPVEIMLAKREGLLRGAARLPGRRLPPRRDRLV